MIGLLGFSETPNSIHPRSPAGLKADPSLHSIAAKIDAGLTSPGDYEDEVASLSSKVAVEYERLNQRLSEMAGVFREAASSLRSAVRFAR